MTQREEFRKRLIEQRCAIETAESLRRSILAEAISDFHFMTHKAANFWENCENSPVGICVWKLEDEEGNFIRPGQQCCHYCGDPQERK